MARVIFGRGNPDALGFARDYTMSQAVKPLFSFMFVVTVAATIPSMARTQTQSPALQKTLRDWEERRNQVKTIRYRVEGERLFPKGLIGTNDGDSAPRRSVPETDTWARLSRVLWLDLENSRFRLEVLEPGMSRSQGVYFLDRVSVFTGRELKVLNPGDPNPDMAATRGKLNMAIVVGPGDAETSGSTGLS